MKRSPHLLVTLSAHGFGHTTQTAPVVNDWPEEPYLVKWLERHGRCMGIDRSRLAQGEVLEHLETLWALPSPPPVVPSGITQAAEYLHSYF